MNDITIRFLRCYEHLKEEKKVFSPKGFANEINVSNSLITEICKKRTNAGITPIQNLIIRFPEFSAKWLLTGEGNFINDIVDNSIKPDTYTFELQKRYIEKLEAEIEELKKEEKSTGSLLYVAEPREKLSDKG